MNEPIEDGVGVSWVADESMPFVDGDLAGEDGRAAPVALLEDFVEVTTRAGVERFEAPIVEDQELGTVEAAHDAGVAAVATGQGEIGKELGDAVIEHGAIVATGLVAEGAGKPTLADAGRAREILPKNSASMS